MSWKALNQVQTFNSRTMTVIIDQSVNSTPGSCSLNSVWILVWKGRHVAMQWSNSFARKSAYFAVWQLEVIGPLSKAGRSGYIQQTQTGTLERHLASGRWVFQKNWTQSFTNRNVRKSISQFWARIAIGIFLQ